MASHVFAGTITLPCFAHAFCSRPRNHVRVRSSDSAVFAGSVVVNGAPEVNEKERNLIDKGNGRLEGKVEKDVGQEKLELLWDDGYGRKNVKDYFDASKEIIKPDGGPPRWFCPVASGKPFKGSPVLLYLPGIDGTGMGLTLHEKALGKVFEVRCLHIPVKDRTPFKGLVRLVEETLRLEYELSPKKPIYLVGDSFGGCLALAVAARNPTIDLVIILVNPATSFDRSQLQPVLPTLEALPDQLHSAFPYFLSFVIGNPLKMAMVSDESVRPPGVRFQQLSRNLTVFLSIFSGFAEFIPKDTFLWKLKLLRSAAAYANSRLHAVKAEVLVLASVKDNMVPSEEEAHRLKSTLQDCQVRFFKDNGHTLLLEDSLSLLTVIKGTCKYRRARKVDLVSDFLPPCRTEYNYCFTRLYGLLHIASSSVMFSTLSNGQIVRGLKGVPDEGPVLMVGYHTLLGLELSLIIQEFIREKNIMIRGLAHPDFFFGKLGNAASEFSILDWFKVFGALPVTASNIFKSLSSGSHVLLYPGGIREAFHNKGEEYKLFWPDQPEFVRMAARFEATIVPFAAVGEDDLAELVLDYNDQMSIPMVSDYVRQAANDAISVRANGDGEVANQRFYLPGILPKVPGRFYFLFGKPIKTKGMKEILKDKENANEMYIHIKSEVERSLEYLIKKREEDPYRSILDRFVYQTINTVTDNIPTFEP